MGPQLFLDGHDAFVNETLGDGGGVLDGFECGCLIERQVLHAQGSEEILILLVFARFKERGFKCADDFFRRALGRVHADTDADDEAANAAQRAAFHESEERADVEAPAATTDSLGAGLDSILARRGN